MRFGDTYEERAFNAESTVERIEKAVQNVMSHMRDKNAGVLRLGLSDNDRSRQALKELFDLMPNVELSGREGKL